MAPGPVGLVDDHDPVSIGQTVLAEAVRVEAQLVPSLDVELEVRLTHHVGGGVVVHADVAKMVQVLFTSDPEVAALLRNVLLEEVLSLSAEEIPV